MNIAHTQTLRHPLEKDRVQGYRPYGFDNMGPVFAFIEEQVNLYDQNSFYKTYQDDKDYLFIKAEKQKNADKASLRFMVELDVGYIDFQDKEHVSLMRINAIFHVEPNDITLLSAHEEDKKTTDIEYVLEAISNNGYFNLVKTKAEA